MNLTESVIENNELIHTLSIPQCGEVRSHPLIYRKQCPTKKIIRSMVDTRVSQIAAANRLVETERREEAKIIAAIAKKLKQNKKFADRLDRRMDVCYHGLLGVLNSKYIGDDSWFTDVGRVISNAMHASSDIKLGLWTENAIANPDQKTFEHIFGRQRVGEECAKLLLEHGTNFTMVMMLRIIHMGVQGVMSTKSENYEVAGPQNSGMGYTPKEMYDMKNIKTLPHGKPSTKTIDGWNYYLEQNGIYDATLYSFD